MVEGYYWIQHENGDWRVAEYDGGSWYYCGNEEAWGPPHLIGPKLEPPTFMVLMPSGTRYGPFTLEQANNYVAKQYPGSGAKVVPC